MDEFYKSEDEIEYLPLDRKEQLLKTINNDPWAMASYGCQIDELLISYEKCNPLKQKRRGPKKIYVDKGDFIEAARKAIHQLRGLGHIRITQKDVARRIPISKKAFQNYLKDFGIDWEWLIRH